MVPDFMLKVYRFLTPALAWMKEVLLPISYGYLLCLGIFASFQSIPGLKAGFVVFIAGALISIWRFIVVWRNHGINNYLNKKHKKAALKTAERNYSN